MHPLESYVNNLGSESLGLGLLVRTCIARGNGEHNILAVDRLGHVLLLFCFSHNNCFKKKGGSLLSLSNNNRDLLSNRRTVLLSLITTAHTFTKFLKPILGQSR